MLHEILNSTYLRHVCVDILMSNDSKRLSLRVLSIFILSIL